VARVLHLGYLQQQQYRYNPVPPYSTHSARYGWLLKHLIRLCLRLRHLFYDTLRLVETICTWQPGNLVTLLQLPRASFDKKPKKPKKPKKLQKLQTPSKAFTAPAFQVPSSRPLFAPCPFRVVLVPSSLFPPLFFPVPRLRGFIHSSHPP
jgi:hypothetical protein